MFQKIVQKLLNRILGEYVQNFNSENLNIGIWKGQVIIQNVRLKSDVIKKMNLPINIKYSRLGCLRMNIPWSSLGSSKIDIFVDGLEVIVGEIPQKLWECKNNKIIEHRKKEIQAYCDMIIADFANKANNVAKNQDKEQGYLSTMLVKIIDNIQVVVRNIHVRFEDDLGEKFSFGVTLEELKIYTVNKQGEPEFIDRTKKVYENQPLRKKLFLANLGVYWNQKSTAFNPKDPSPEMMGSIARQDDKVKKKMNYLILMSFNAMLYQREPGKQFEQPQINLSIGFNQLKVEITNEQLQQIVTLGERLQKYSNEVKAQNRKKLTQLEMIANREVFMTLFPKYFQKKCSVKEMNTFDQILEKMETVNFEESIKKFLQEKQKEKMIQERIQKSAGWFTGPKELTEQEVAQIEKFITQNFGKQTKVVKRPQNFYYIRVNFNLKILELSIANQNPNSSLTEGIRLRFSQIQMKFNLRQEGYMLDFAMNDIRCDLFKSSANSSSTSPQQLINIIQKVKSPQPQPQQSQSQSVRLQVFGNPLTKKHLNQQIIVRTQELMIQFHPMMVRVLKQFADVRLSSENEEAALQVYGELRNLASTAANQSLRKPIQKKSFISIDVKISAISLLLFFDPMKTSADVWVLKIGEINIFSDPQVLRKVEYHIDEPMQKYGLRFAKVSFMHFLSKKAYFNNRSNGIQTDSKDKVVSDLGIDIELQLFKQNAIETIPKIRLKTVLHNIDISFSQFTYQSIQKISQCLTLPQQQKRQTSEQQQKQKLLSKTSIMKQATKIGILYQQSKHPKKYIGVLKGPYLYLYKDKKDLDYAAYYYLKNCEIVYNNETDSEKKMFEVVFRNAVNQLVLGFERVGVMEEWVKAVKDIDTSDKFKGTIQQKQKQKQKELALKRKKSSLRQSPNKLQFQICASVEQVTIKTLLPNLKQITISINTLQTRLKLHQLKNTLTLSLHSLQISDNIYLYKYRELNHLLYSTAIEGKEKLIEIGVVMNEIAHPEWDGIGVKVGVQFGKLICNYKPETVERLMNFYVPKDGELAKIRKEKGEELTKEQKQALEQQKKRRRLAHIQSQLQKNLPETFSIQISLKIEQISASLVNRNNKVMFARVGLTGFSYRLAISTRQIVMSGRLEEMWVGDYSDYPDTIYQERERYMQVCYLVESNGHSRDMLEFGVKLVEIPDEAGKTMFITVNVYDVKASYIQQPVLRIITYILQQVLPSLTPPQDLTQVKQLPKNDTKPLESTMVLEAYIENAVAIVEPRCKSGEEQFLQLNVNKIQVKNSSCYRAYVRSDKQGDLVLVENYMIKMQEIKILQKFRGQQTKLTNDLNFTVSCDLIQNSPYYKKTYKSLYDPGMRIECQLSPFVMCLNHDDYNFIMKCLYWNITYDDNAEGYFFTPLYLRQTIREVRETSQPLHFGLTMNKIILCVTEGGFPLSVLLLSQMRYDLTLEESGMNMIFKMKHLSGTTISRTKDSKICLERGMFNSFGYRKEHLTEHLYNMNTFVNQFSRIELTKQTNLTNENAVHFKMSTITKTGQSFITLKIKDIGIAIELKTLITLSKLALMQEYIQPPKSQILPININAKPKLDNDKACMSINVEMDSFLGCLGDRNFENYIVMEGAFTLKMKLVPTRTDQQLLQLAKTSPLNGRFRDSSTYETNIRKYSLYFCNVNDLLHKRFLLQPLNVLLIYRQSYGKQKQGVYMESEIDGMIDRVIVECSVKDLLLVGKIVQENLEVLAEANRGGDGKDKNKEENKEQLKKKISVKSQEKELSKLIMHQQQKVQFLPLQSHLDQPPQKPQSDLQSSSIHIDKDALKRTIKQPPKKLKSKTKGTIKLEPIQLRVVNDCGYNFMPVINFVAQESCLMYSSDAYKSLYMLVLTFKLDFFNPRSASWEPIIENFRISFDYLQINNNPHANPSRLVISGTEIQQLKQLKFNISTQLITTLLATVDIAKKQRKSLYSQQIHSKQLSQISPYILENKTNHILTIYRQLDGLKSNIDLKSLFKGQLRMSDKGELLRFQYRNRVCETGMEKFGYVSIPNVRDLHLEFKIEKLNRIICFVDKVTIKNSTFKSIYCIRYNENHQKIQDILQIAPQDTIPVKQTWYIQFSFNQKTFTPPTKIPSLFQIHYLKAESQKFKLAITKRDTILDHCVISIRAPFIISNCLPKDIKLQFITNGKHVSTREIAAQSCHQVFANEGIDKFRFKIIAEGFYWSQEFWMDFEGEPRDDVRVRESVIRLNDRQKGMTNIVYTFQQDGKRRQFKLSLSCPAFIVSELEQDVHIYGNLKSDQQNKKIERYYQLGGQSQFWKTGQEQKKQAEGPQRTIDKITIVGTEVGSKLRICGSNCIIDFSEPFNINSIGVHQARVVVERQIGIRKTSVFTMLGLEIQLHKMTKRSNIISKQITIRYRYIISNISNSDILIRQEGSEKLCFHVAKGQKKPFYYTMPAIGTQPRSMIIKTPNTMESLPLLSNSLGIAYFRLKVRKEAKRMRREAYSIQLENVEIDDDNEWQYYMLNTQQLKSYIFYQFTSIRYEDLPYQVTLKSPLFKLFVPIFQKVLTQNTPSLMFINEIPQYGFKLFMLIQLQGTEKVEEVTVEADNVNFSQVLNFRGPERMVNCYIHILLNDSKKVIVIEELSSTQHEAQHQLQSINIRLQKLSLSLIQNHSNITHPYQSFYLYLYNLQLLMQKSNLSTKYQARLQFLQFDQQEPFNIPDPVILTAEKFKQHTVVSKNGGNTGRSKIKSIFNMYVEVDNHFVRNLCFNCIKIEINNIVVRATTYLIKLVLAIMKEYNEVFKSESQFLIQRHTNTWKSIAIPPQGIKTFIKSIQIAPFTVLISAMIRVDEQDVESALFRTFLNALGVVITDIDNAPIIFDGIVLDNCVDSVQGIQHKLMEHYKAAVMRQLYKILGSLNIIGNPVSLFRNISTGIQDLKDKPAEGFVEGPLQFGKGIADGTTSLIAHSIGGALNSVEKVTGTIANGLTVLTFDREFDEARQKQKMKKPKHFFEGLEKGGRAVFHGFKEGITGVVTKPIEQTKKSGAIGLVKGVGQGLAGLVVKPVTGIVDFASKTTQGLKNTALYLQDKPNQTRIRYPRVFYTECFIIREYNPVDSKILSIINRTKYQQKYGFQNSIFISAFQITPQKYLLVLKQDIVMIRIDNDRIEWVIPIDSLNVNKEMEDGREKIRISADSRREWYTRKVNDVVEFVEQSDGDAFLGLVDDLRANMKDRTINESHCN